ncbi:MAG: hypothetical protein WC444_05780 [Candidatus Paceibacterota bacterium]
MDYNVYITVCPTVEAESEQEAIKKAKELLGKKIEERDIMEAKAELA